MISNGLQTVNAAKTYDYALYQKTYNNKIYSYEHYYTM